MRIGFLPSASIFNISISCHIPSCSIFEYMGPEPVTLLAHVSPASPHYVATITPTSRLKTGNRNAKHEAPASTPKLPFKTRLQHLGPLRCGIPRGRVHAHGFAYGCRTKPARARRKRERGLCCGSAEVTVVTLPGPYRSRSVRREGRHIGGYVV
ncbi:hypothetical protein BU26DRAFT_317236 [Trematosphaeria pertusa]|uniref:Uncharacterized protein n=1 Tax=Trematosphaeria pertusa TaxID=390896 RepID=A0A6A6IFZ9_9PLEO|nr:uncharacterized protein BU26DRAFT_317236 [Trematosphaeria pertusa]KAF2249361.1 hypothetical protein BU26DRAFT_317236 [Trematosphaeria pertusa]